MQPPRHSASHHNPQPLHHDHSANGAASNPPEQQQQQQVLKCPRCGSLNTKFCYYNNYSLLQPRHFCKSCRRYWTKGGGLRNVPVGGGCRKNNKKCAHSVDKSSSSPSAANKLLLKCASSPTNTQYPMTSPSATLPHDHQLLSSTPPPYLHMNSPTVPTISTGHDRSVLLPPPFSTAAPPLAYPCSFPPSAQDNPTISLPLFPPPYHSPLLQHTHTHTQEYPFTSFMRSLTGDLRVANTAQGSTTATSHLATLAPSTLASLSSQLPRLSLMRNGLMGLSDLGSTAPPSSFPPQHSMIESEGIVHRSMPLASDHVFKSHLHLAPLSLVQQHMDSSSGPLDLPTTRQLAIKESEAITSDHSFKGKATDPPDHMQAQVLDQQQQEGQISGRMLPSFENQGTSIEACSNGFLQQQQPQVALMDQNSAYWNLSTSAITNWTDELSGYVTRPASTSSLL